MCDMTRWYVVSRHLVLSGDSFICATRLVDICNMTRSYLQQDSFICATWLVAPWLVAMCNMTRCYAQHDSLHIDLLLCATWLVDICNVTRWILQHDSLICQLTAFRPLCCERNDQLIDLCGVTASCVSRDSEIGEASRPWLIVTYMKESCHTCMWHDPLGMINSLWRDSFSCATWPSHMSSHSVFFFVREKVCHDRLSHIWKSYIMHVCDMTR